MYSATRVSIDSQLASDAERHQAGGQHHEQHGNAVHAHVVGDAAAQPAWRLDELEGRRSCGRTPAHSTSDRTKVGDGGDQRDPARVARDGRVEPRSTRIASAPSSGRKVMREAGRWLMARLPAHEPGGQRHHAEQHREGVVIDIAGLQPDRAARRIQHAGGDAVGPKPVDDRAVADLPQEAADARRPGGRTGSRRARRNTICCRGRGRAARVAPRSARGSSGCRM